MTPSLERTVRRLQDRVDILETMYRYCRHADAQDAEAMTALFTDDCVVSYLDDKEPIFRNCADLLESRRASLANTLSGNHYISNAELIWDNDDVVLAHVYMYSWQRFRNFPVTADCHRWGRYECRFVRTDAGWRFSHMTLCSAGEYGGARIGEHLGRPWPPQV